MRKATTTLLYKFSAVLLNMHACIYNRGKVVDQFHVNQPSMERYLNSNYIQENLRSAAGSNFPCNAEANLLSHLPTSASIASMPPSVN